MLTNTSPAAIPLFAARPDGSTPTTNTPEARYAFFSRHVSVMRDVASPRLAAFFGGASSSARSAEHSVASAVAASTTANLERLPSMSMDDNPFRSAIHGRYPGHDSCRPVGSIAALLQCLTPEG